MSIDGPRFAAFLAFTERGMTPDDASSCVMALHPLDDAPVPGRAFEKAVRSRSRTFAKDAKRALPSRALSLARSALAEYKALAHQHGETYYQTRYDQYLPGGQAVVPEAPAASPTVDPAPFVPPPQAGSASSTAGWWNAPIEDSPPPPPTDAPPAPGPDGVNAAWNYASPSRPEHSPSPYSTPAPQPAAEPVGMPAPISGQRVPIEREVGGGAAPPQSFVGAISTCLTKYAVFSGRASRSEYWFFWLFGFIMNWGSLFVFSAILPFELAQTLWGLVSLALILPLLAAAVRRLHDAGKSGFFVFVPLYNLVLLVSPGTDGPNRFG